MNEKNKTLLSRIKKENIEVFSIISIVGMITYSSSFIWELSNPDTMWSGVYQRSKWAWECSLGRYMLRIWQEMFGAIINPSAFTIISILLVAIIGVIVVNIFQLRGVAAVLTGVVIMLSPAVAGTLTYYYCSLYYIIAYTLAVIACRIICIEKKWYYCVIAMFLLCISMATYQTYIGIVAVIACIYILGMLLDEKIDIKDIITRTLYIWISVVGGVAFYLVSNKLIQKWWGVVAESGRGFAQMGTIPFERLGKLLKNCYLYTYQYFFSNEMINNSYGLKKEINIVYYALLLLLLVYVVFMSKKKWLYKILAGVCICILPIAMMSITVVAPDVSIYDTTGVIMLPTMNYAYIVLLFVANYLNKNERVESICRIVSKFEVGIICFSLFVFSLTMQTYHKICLNKMDYLAKKIVDSIEDAADYTSNYTLCFWGNLENGNYPEAYPELKEKIKWTTASNGTVWKWYDWNPGIAQLCWIGYIKQYTGKEYELCGDVEYKEIIDSGIIRNMSNFPDEDSVVVYDDSVIVIKLGDM